MLISEDTVPGAAFVSIFGEGTDLNHGNKADKATSNESTSIQPSALMIENILKEEKRALRAERDKEIKLQYRDLIYGPMFRYYIGQMHYPAEVINHIYWEGIVWPEVKLLRKLYSLPASATPQKIHECFIVIGLARGSNKYTSEERLEKFEWLIRAGARADAVGPDGLSFLYTAVKGTDDLLVKALLRAGARHDDPQWDGWDLLKAAVIDGRAVDAQTIMNACRKVRRISETNQLYRLVMAGDMRKAQKHIEGSAETNGIPEQDRQGLICLAVRRYYVPTIELLLRHGADPHAKCAARYLWLLSQAKNSEINRILQKLDFQF